MEELRLKKIAEVVGAKCDADIPISSICTDTRKIEKGCLFIAFEGERFDAHDFAAQAAEQGAAALICHKKVTCSAPVLYVEDTRTAYLDIAGYYRSLFSIPLVGITGSVGKTTTKEFIALALSAKFKTLKTEGNFNNDIGMPATLLRLDSSYEAAVIEMGMNHFGEIHNLVLRSRPTMGVITNIGVSHIENLGSRDGILKAKLEILDGMQPDAPLLLNADNDKLATVKVEGRPVYYFGIENPGADFRAQDIRRTTESTDFTIVYSGGRQEVHIPAVGNHNVLNALCAFGVAVLSGIDAKKVAQKLAEYEPAGRRQKIVKCSDFTVIEDCYNASTDSMRAAIETLAQMNAKKKIAVLADMLELGDYAQRLHEEVGEFCARQKIDAVLAYGDQARFYCEKAKEGGVPQTEFFEDKQALLEAVSACAEDDSVLLFKGSNGMHLEETINALYERKGIKHE
ncbi:MAG: UDP-N-acetylmuramoyl-tripeptide--D-alanyl-D-alanine ligase [Clostridia bacterium]|nr:UDP-N-acetylmuramoyl-tripeptide--D-alanyl-D-alanine ligase [Clostridia bacterium]